MLLNIRQNIYRTLFRKRMAFNKGIDVASAAVVTLGTDGNTFDITGTTTITHLNPTNWDNGAIIVLQFDGALILTHASGSDTSVAASLRLRGARNYTTVAGDRLMFVLRDDVWTEIARTQIGAQTQQARFQFGKGADVASATTITLGADGNVFALTGTTAVDYITTTNWQAGSLVILLFDTSITVGHNKGSAGAGAAKMLLAGAADLSATANDQLGLVYDGTLWREVFRTVV